MECIFFCYCGYIKIVSCLFVKLDRGCLYTFAVWWTVGMVRQTIAGIPKLSYADRMAAQRMSSSHDHPEFWQGKSKKVLAAIFLICYCLLLNN